MILILKINKKKLKENSLWDLRILKLISIFNNHIKFLNKMKNYKYMKMFKWISIIKDRYKYK